MSRIALATTVPDWSTVRDHLVRSAVVLWFLLLAAIYTPQLIATFQETAATDTLAVARLFSKVCMFLFLLLIAWLTVARSRPLARAAGWQPRAAAVLGTNLIFFGLIFLPARDDLGIAMHFLSAVLILTGNMVALAILLRLGRSFSIMAEARQLVTDGPYAFIRHPLYLAEQIAIIGIFIQFASLPTAALIIVQFAFQIQRMRNEEAVLSQTFAGYAAYMARTARLIPGVW